MFSFNRLCNLDLTTLPDIQKQLCLKYLRIMHPKVNHFKAGGEYECVDDMSRPIKAIMTHDVFFIREDKDHVAWYVGDKREVLVGNPVDANFYAISTKQIYTTDPDNFPLEMTFHVVSVDFNQPLNTPSARYLAKNLPMLAEHFDISHFKQGTNVLGLENDVILLLTLSHALVPRQSSKYPGEARYALLNEVLGSGTFAKVYDNPATLRIGDHHMFDRRDKNRVGRFSLISQMTSSSVNGLALSRIQNEDKVMKALQEQLKSKPAFFKPSRRDPSVSVAIRFEKRMPGKSLDKFIDDGSTCDWSLEARLRVAIELLHALHEKVHEKGVIHCDVKPANVMVADWDARCVDRPKVNFIDFNLSRFKRDQSVPTSIVGTPLYLSPERFNVSFIPNEASDVYAAGITLAELFGHKPVDLGQSMPAAFARATHYQLTGLFNDLPLEDRIPENDQIYRHIFGILTAMVDPVPDNRPSLSEAEKWFEGVLLRKIADSLPCFSRARQVGI